MGAWITYGLGSENQDLPGFIAMCPGGYPIVATQNWRTAFLPRLPGDLHRHPACRGRQADRKHPQRGDEARGPAAQLDLVRRLNEHHAASRPHDPALEHGSSRSSWPIACRARRPRPSTSPASPIDPRDVRAGYPGPPAPDHPAAARARRAVHPGLERRQPAVGRPREHRRPPPPARRRVGPGHRRVPGRSQAARAIRPGAGDLGRRIRPDARRRVAGALGPRSQSLRLLDVAGRGGARAAMSTAPPTSSASPLSPTRSTSTTCTPRSCTSWDWITSGSPSATPAGISARPTSTGGSSRNSWADARRRDPPFPSPSIAWYNGARRLTPP